MLLAVEGGGFFSSSASGYSKGLTLLLLGRKSEEKPMRVSPWNQYQLVDEASDPDLQLASGRNQLSPGCATFVCFGRPSAGLEAPSPLKVGPSQQQDVMQTAPVSEKSKDHATGPGDGSVKKVSLRSSLKKPSHSVSVSSDEGNALDAVAEKEDNIPDCTERRVKWTDICGKELVEIREFEPSEVDGSDDEFDYENERSCSCAVM